MCSIVLLTRMSKRGNWAQWRHSSLHYGAFRPNLVWWLLKRFLSKRFLLRIHISFVEISFETDFFWNRFLLNQISLKEISFKDMSFEEILFKEISFVLSKKLWPDKIFYTNISLTLSCMMTFTHRELKRHKDRQANLLVHFFKNLCRPELEVFFVKCQLVFKKNKSALVRF